MKKPFHKYIDHTLLKPDASESDIETLCREALEYNFYSVCVNGCHVPLAARLLAGSDIRVAAVAGFPLGAASTVVKLAEISQALEDGADEVDVVMNIGALKDHRLAYILEEVSMLARLCHQHNALLKLIIETCLLTDDEIVTACRLAEEGGADFVKTSTGFSSGGATTKNVALMRASVSGNTGVKASGGIKTYASAKALIDKGADRLGCSASVSILEEYHAKQKSYPLFNYIHP